MRVASSNSSSGSSTTPSDQGAKKQEWTDIRDSPENRRFWEELRATDAGASNSSSSSRTESKTRSTLEADLHASLLASETKPEKKKKRKKHHRRFVNTLQLRGDTAVSDADSGKGFECLVCATNYRRVMNHGCGHRILCLACGEDPKTLTQLSTCPLCSKDITTLQTVERVLLLYLICCGAPLVCL
jgi:hypothetical protein